MIFRTILKIPWVAFKRVRTPWWRRHHVESDSVGFRIISTVDADEPEHWWEWSDVVRVEAFRRDLYMIELICVTISTRNDSCELNHKMRGWSGFVEMLEEAIPEQFPEAEWFPAGANPMIGRYPLGPFDNSGR